MKIELYDRVLLKSGNEASIVYIYEQGKAYEADIDMPNGDTTTETIKHQDIKKKIRNK